MIFSEAMKLQHEVARRQGWHIRPVGREFGLFSPDDILVGMPCVSSDEAWRIGLDNGVPKWGRDLNASWDLIEQLDIAIEPVARQPDQIWVMLAEGKSHSGPRTELARLIAAAWLDYQWKKEKRDVDHVDA